MNFLDRADAIARKIERFVSGSGPSDPLYLSNRSLGQKVRLVLLIGTPVIAIGGLVALALSNYFQPAPSAQRVAATMKEPGTVTAKVLPDLEKTYKSESDHDCEVTEAAVAGNTLTGKLRNNTDRTVRSADLVFDLTDDDGSQLGAVAVHVENIAARDTANFRLALEQRTAKTALVREIHTH
jgi:hypothetical protein